MFTLIRSYDGVPRDTLGTFNHLNEAIMYLEGLTRKEITALKNGGDLDIADEGIGRLISFSYRTNLH